MGDQLCEGAADGLFMQFADLAGDRCFAFFGAGGSQLFKGLDEPERRLIDDEGLVKRCEILQARLTAFLLRQEALEIEMMSGSLYRLPQQRA